MEGCDALGRFRHLRQAEGALREVVGADATRTGNRVIMVAV